MNYTNLLLDQVKSTCSLTSEYQLAKKLDVAHSSLRRWRKGENAVCWETAFKIADILQEDDQNIVNGLMRDKFDNPRLVRALRGLG